MKKPFTASYDVGYCKPPANTRFRKGQSGNPNGRPRGITPDRANRLVLKEAYRLLRVKEGDEVHHLPAYQAVLRSYIASAAKGNGPAQRAFIALVQYIEQLPANQAQGSGGYTALPEMTDAERAEALVDILAKIKLQEVPE